MLVSHSDIGEVIKEKAEENKLLTELRKMLISTSHITNGISITPFFSFYLNPGPECNQIHRSAQYTPLRCVKIFVQSAVNARER